MMESRDRGLVLAEGAMERVSVDLGSARRLGVAEAKVGLSAYVADVESSGAAYIIERYGRPAALLMPVPQKKLGSNRARGVLASYADPDKRKLEEGAFARAMEAKHGHAD